MTRRRRSRRQMIELQFPDGSRREYPDGSSARDVAAAISKSLEKRTILSRLDGVLIVGRCEDDWRQFRVAARDRETVETGHADVQQHDVRLQRGDPRYRLEAVRRLARDDDIGNLVEHPAQAPPSDWFIVDDQDAQRHSAGNARRTT